MLLLLEVHDGQDDCGGRRGHGGRRGLNHVRLRLADGDDVLVGLCGVGLSGDGDDVGVDGVVGHHGGGGDAHGGRGRGRGHHLQPGGFDHDGA